MISFEIKFNDLNTITYDMAKEITILDMLEIGHKYPETTFMLVNEMAEEDYAELTGPYSIECYAYHNEEDNGIAYEINFSDNRKYYTELIDLELFHEKLGEAILKRGHNRGFGHEAPVQYLTVAAQNIDPFMFGRNNTLEEVFRHLDSEAQAIHKEATLKASLEHIERLEQVVRECS